jgi:large subunit ribosomal protein L6
MSKIGGKPITIPEGVTVTVDPKALTVKGKLGSVLVPVLSSVSVEIKDGKINLTISSDKKQAHANWGTMGAHIKNALTGVSVGFKKQLEIQGVGFKGVMEAKTLSLSLGFSHPVKFPSPEGVTIIIEKNIITVSGFNRYDVGQAAAKIRELKKPEPYQGKGIRYVGEHVRQKEGKKVAGSGAAA